MCSKGDRHAYTRGRRASPEAAKDQGAAGGWWHTKREGGDHRPWEMHPASCGFPCWLMASRITCVHAPPFAFDHDNRNRGLGPVVLISQRKKFSTSWLRHAGRWQPTDHLTHTGSVDRSRLAPCRLSATCRRRGVSRPWNPARGSWHPDFGRA